MHVLLIHQAFAGPNDPGGTRHYELASGLVARGHRVTVITSAVTYMTGEARVLREACARTVRRKVASFDCGFWSLYEHSGTRLPMLASPFYHGLHISQLSITARLLDMPELVRWAERWREYGRSALYRRRAFVQKAAFKLLYY